MLSKRLMFLTSILALAVCGALRAAELGEVKVNSHIGQQLSADIELVDLTAADLAELQARLANPDVFKGAGLEMPAELAGLHIAVARRDNKRFLHLTTLQPVKGEALHLFLELNAGGRQIIRAASLWLTPEPPGQRVARVADAPAAPAASPAPASPPLASPVSANVPAQASGEAGLNEAAQRAFAYRRQKALEQAQARAAGQEQAMAAPVPSTVSTAATVTPVAAAAARTSAPAAGPSPAGAPARQVSAAPQSCAPAKQVEAQLQQCQAMSSKLADIEGKVRHLQTAIAAPVPAAAAKVPAMVTPAPVPKAEETAGKPAQAPAKPASAPVKPGATPVKPGVAADLAGNSRMRLIMIVAGALGGLGALGATIYFLRKRQNKGPLQIWQSFRKKGAPEEQEEVPELTEQVAAQ